MQKLLKIDTQQPNKIKLYTRSFITSKLFEVTEEFKELKFQQNLQTEFTKI